MAIQVTAKSMEEIPEEMREFVTEDNGVFSYDSGKAFAALKAERESAKSARNALAPYKALNLSAEEIKAFSDLGKSPEELAQMIAKAAMPAVKPNVKNSTEYLELKKQLDDLKGFQAKWEAAEAENLKNKRNDFVRKAVRELPDEYDKETCAAFIETQLDRFTLNDAKDGLNPVGEKLPVDFIRGLADQFHFRKPSNPGSASPGNATIQQNGNARYEAAKAKGDVMGMFQDAPPAQ